MEPTATNPKGLSLIRQQIHEYVAMNFLYDGSGATVENDTPLVEQGVIDQTGVLELALFVEDTYGIQVDETDLTPDNFDTINNLAGYVYTRLANA